MSLITLQESTLILYKVKVVALAPYYIREGYICSYVMVNEHCNFVAQMIHAKCSIKSLNHIIHM